MSHKRVFTLIRWQPGSANTGFCSIWAFHSCEFRASIARTAFCAILWRSPIEALGAAILLWFEKGFESQIARVELRFEVLLTVIWGIVLRFGLHDLKSLAICDVWFGAVKYYVYAAWRCYHAWQHSVSSWPRNNCGPHDDGIYTICLLARGCKKTMRRKEICGREVCPLTNSELLLWTVFGRTDFSWIFIFFVANFFADVVAGFFSPFFYGKTCPEKSPGKSRQNPLNLCNKNPWHSSAEGPGQKL